MDKLFLWRVRILCWMVGSGLLLGLGWTPLAVHAQHARQIPPASMQSPAQLDNLPPLPFSRPLIRPPASTFRTGADGFPSGEAPSVRGLMDAPDPATSPAVQAARVKGEKWIEVDLSEQKVYAYEGDRRVNTFVVSTGLPGTPTVTGEFRMWIRTPIQDMSGGNRAAGTYYYLKDVQWVQYFYQDYAFHGTYWHNNFGQPMSRGCVNMTNEDAQWLFEWAFPQWNGERGWFKPTEENATLVIVHP
ncbi:L,D-transpeptidase family protein [Litorilinea aerophila]|nr:L,D-transpeptidase [Litorilinea aerophila]MCC9075980.1 L,D-transpeptidase family protein [Litorilinea aerophila]